MREENYEKLLHINTSRAETRMDTKKIYIAMSQHHTRLLSSYLMNIGQEERTTL